MKVLAVLLGLVILACSKREDVETLKAQVMTALTTELMKMDYNPNQAATIARFIVEDKDDWRYLMKERSNLGSSFLSSSNMQEILEEVLPNDVEHLLLYGKQIQRRDPKNDDDEDDDDDE